MRRHLPSQWGLVLFGFDLAVDAGIVHFWVSETGRRVGCEKKESLSITSSSSSPGPHQIDEVGQTHEYPARPENEQGKTITAPENQYEEFEFDLLSQPAALL